jgi:hypothetical protein
MTRIVMIDGELVPHERATVSVFDRGFSQSNLYIPTSRSHYQPPPPNQQTHRVFSSAVLGGDPPWFESKKP